MRPIPTILLLSIALGGCATLEPAPEADTAITNVAIVSGRATIASDPVDVFLRDGKIIAIEPAGTRPITSKSTAVVDAAGKYLIPGLIDSHTHLGQIPGMTSGHEQAFPAIAAKARAQLPHSFLYHGFTTVIDLHSRPETIDAWNDQAIRPYAYFCGAAPLIDGYPMVFSPKPRRYETTPYFLYDASQSGSLPTSLDRDEHSPEAVARRIRADGGICVKTHYETGFGDSKGLPVPSQTLIQALVNAAHEKGLPVLLHANSEAAYRFGNATGVDAFAHGLWTWKHSDDAALPTVIRTVLDTSLRASIGLQPTIQVLYGEQDIHNERYLDDFRLRNVLPAELIDWYRSAEGQWWRQRLRQIPNVADLVNDGRWDEVSTAPVNRATSALRYFSGNGGRLLFGSDTPSSPTFANPPGLNGRIEMDHWVAAGVSLPALFAAATIDNAEFFGLDAHIGTVAVGKRADLLLLDENPLSSISAYDSISVVIVNGNVLIRAHLSATHGN